MSYSSSPDSFSAVFLERVINHQEIDPLVAVPTAASTTVAGVCGGSIVPHEVSGREGIRSDSGADRQRFGRAGVGGACDQIRFACKSGHFMCY